MIPGNILSVFRHHYSTHPLITAIDSAGTAAYHTGSDPDPRSLATLRAHGITAYSHSARQVREADFLAFDWIVGMDRENVADLRKVREKVVRKRKGKGGGEGEGVARVGLWGDWGGQRGEVVVDPYYGADTGFEVAFEQMGRFGKGFVKVLEEGGLE
ncbi:phosphotyrosine protein phosphatases I [Eremomyces bilateralis CBS 781.70]|uniref:Phosphotyrosine protein phosphatases I n=1 Tax=Eremomyces bilateralis CBS 781.70 TaxID=1392243 RepID=A0A6G1G238_9PEZI|nr:phosphotyrosine protein phosphatases I [Eremomyces bilateralis CBS 781.70]KAF1811869.1 phosphotyrosine protein phosphatases I [Eremomyces bilateralis CBS 781.70]